MERQHAASAPRLDWVDVALRTGTLGVAALALDGTGAHGHDDAERIGRAIVRRYGLRTSAQLDDTLALYRDTRWHLLGGGDRRQLLGCIQRHGDPGFPARAAFRPAITRFLPRGTAAGHAGQLAGGGVDDAGPDLAARFDRVFGGGGVVAVEGGARGVPRRRPKNYTRVEWDDTLSSADLDTWSLVEDFAETGAP